MPWLLPGSRIATYACRGLVFRFRLALRLHLPAPAEGAAAGPRDRIPPGAVRGAAQSLGSERARGTALEAPLHLPLEPLVGAQPGHPVALSGGASVQSAAP